MKAVLTRVSSARVLVDGEVVGELPRPGILGLVGISVDDGGEDVATMARKIAELRILTVDEAGDTAEVSASDIDAPVLLVSQFTLYGDTRKGRRPSWQRAAPSADAEPQFDALVEELRKRSLSVSTGVFGAHMYVESVNDGPFTVLVETSP